MKCPHHYKCKFYDIKHCHGNDVRICDVKEVFDKKK